jgi:hypothetical protein
MTLIILGILVGQQKFVAHPSRALAANIVLMAARPQDGAVSGAQPADFALSRASPINDGAGDD